MQTFDVVIIGAGAAGLYCAAEAAQRKKKVLLIDHSPTIGEKIRISGGGKCNFTNRTVGIEHFVSGNPRFARYALHTFTPDHFQTQLAQAGLSWFEKHKGQLFCEQGSTAIIQWLLRRCTDAGVTLWNPCSVKELTKSSHFHVYTSRGIIHASKVVLATGGLAIPQIGSTDQGIVWAQQFGLPVVPTKPGLVPLRFSEPFLPVFQQLAGVSLPVEIKVDRTSFTEDLLFTHRGLSGPATLQVSSYWDPSTPIGINFLPQADSLLSLLKEQRQGNRSSVVNYLSSHLPSRWVDAWMQHFPSLLALHTLKMADISNQHIQSLFQAVQQWQGVPCGTEGYKKAEVMVGGIDTRALSPKTMESKAVAGLYAIGEVVDMTGWLGGYNFQWAWSSAYVCAQAL